MRMDRGESVVIYARKFDDETPEIHVVPGREQTYLWIGGKNGPCYATLSGVKLRKLANAILRGLDGKECQ